MLSQMAHEMGTLMEYFITTVLLVLLSSVIKRFENKCMITIIILSIFQLKYSYNYSRFRAKSKVTVKR